MRKFIALSLAAMVAALLPAVTGSALQAGPGPGYFATDNVQWISTIPLHADSSGARIRGNHLYVTDSRGLTIYDISNAVAPQRLGFYPVPQLDDSPEEDVDTNGRILLIGNRDLWILDVTDKSNPTLMAKLEDVDGHTITCVLDCSWAYLNHGMIVDLRNPAEPKLAGDWTKSAGARHGHDVTEVADGIVVASSKPLYVIDAREDPANPKPHLTPAGSPLTARPPPLSYVHSNLWPHGGTDRFLLVGSESTGSCNTTAESAGAFMTFEKMVDAETQAVTGFEMRDRFRLGTGLPTDGNSPYNDYCAHWFSTHPDYRDGGLVAMGWYQHGTRFFNVLPDGKIKEVGWFLPLGAGTSAAYWVNEEIVYAVDYHRGIDILRVTG